MPFPYDYYRELFALGALRRARFLPAVPPGQVEEGLTLLDLLSEDGEILATEAGENLNSETA